jgi:hypothetical protein
MSPSHPFQFQSSGRRLSLLRGRALHHRLHEFPFLFSVVYVGHEQFRKAGLI